MVDKLLNRFTQLDTLSLGSCLTNVVYKPCLNLLQKHGSRLKSINLNHCTGVTNKGFTSLASGCPLLSVINLAHSNVTDTGLESLTRSCKYLKEINIAWCENVTDRGLLSINQNCGQLRALIITGCREISRLSFSPTLSCLDAIYCDFDSTGIVSESGSCIEYLNLPFLGISPAGLGLGFASKLKILNFYGCSSVKDDDIIKISRGCPLLQHWNLAYCVNLGIAAWDSIGSYCLNLEILHVLGCDYFCDTGLLAIGTGCKRLSVIYINRECCVTFGGVGMFRLQRPDVEIKDDDVHIIVPSWAFTTKIHII